MIKKIVAGAAAFGVAGTLMVGMAATASAAPSDGHRRPVVGVQSDGGGDLTVNRCVWNPRTNKYTCGIVG